MADHTACKTWTRASHSRAVLASAQQRAWAHGCVREESIASFLAWHQNRRHGGSSDQGSLGVARVPRGTYKFTMAMGNRGGARGGGWGREPTET